MSTSRVLIWMSDKLQFVVLEDRIDKLKFVGHPAGHPRAVLPFRASIA